MAVATTAKDSSSQSSGNVSVTAAITIDPAETVVVLFGSFHTPDIAPAGTISDTSSLTWTEINTNGWTYDPGGGASVPRQRLQAWRFKNTTGSAISTTVSCQNGVPSQSTAIAVIGITGNSTSISNFGQNTNANGDPAPSLTSAPASTSSVIGAFMSSGSNAPTAPMGWTQLHRFFTVSGTSRPFQTISDDTTPAQSATWSTPNTNGMGVLIEIPVSTPVGSSSGTATASGVGKASAKAMGSPAGVASVAGAGKARALASGSVAGFGTAAAAGAALATATGSAAGVGNAAGASLIALIGVGVSACAAAAAGIGKALAEGIGLATGSSTASGVGERIVQVVTPSDRVGRISRDGRLAGVVSGLRVVRVFRAGRVG